MRLFSLPNRLKTVLFILLLAAGGKCAAQTADQSFKTIPSQIKSTAETRATTKSTTVSNNAMNKVDSASNKAFKSFTGIFKKKPKKSAADSARVHGVDTTAASAKLP